MNKPIKPVYQSELYAVIRKGATWVVVLCSNFERVQFSGTKTFCIEWAQGNS
jgi:hypothetical protein